MKGSVEVRSPAFRRYGVRIGAIPSILTVSPPKGATPSRVALLEAVQVKRMPAAQQPGSPALSRRRAP